MIDMATMWSVSDIPDWDCVEGGFPYDSTTPPNAEQLVILRSKSPIVHISKVCVIGRVEAYYLRAQKKRIGVQIHISALTVIKLCELSQSWEKG